MKADAAAKREDVKAKINEGAISWTPRVQPRTPTGPSRMQSMPSITPPWVVRTPTGRARRAGRAHYADERAKVAAS